MPKRSSAELGKAYRSVAMNGRLKTRYAQTVQPSFRSLLLHSLTAFPREHIRGIFFVSQRIVLQKTSLLQLKIFLLFKNNFFTLKYYLFLLIEKGMPKRSSAGLGKTYRSVTMKRRAKTRCAQTVCPSFRSLLPHSFTAFPREHIRGIFFVSQRIVLQKTSLLQLKIFLLFNK